MSSAQLKREYASAVAYVGKVGLAQSHLQSSCGKISELFVKTGVCYQESPSVTNYWADKDFDAALAAVIRSEFSVLAKKALGRMLEQYTATRISEKANLLAQLAEIEALEVSAFDVHAFDPS